MLERTILLNKLIKDNNYKSYLEIGAGSGINFNEIICKVKISVDPINEATIMKTSDDFFIENKNTFDIIFVDGLHLSEQVIKDVNNSLSVLNNKGVIVIHDCLPKAEHHQFRERISKNWQGDVWVAIVQLAKEGWYMELKDIETGIVLLYNKKKKYKIPKGIYSWEYYLCNFKNILL
jgi:pyridoxal biosynthesis lyase PdxS